MRKAVSATADVPIRAVPTADGPRGAGQLTNQEGNIIGAQQLLGATTCETQAGYSDQ